MHGLHIWHTPDSAVHASLRRTYPGRIHSGAPTPSGANHRHETRTEYLEEDIRLIRRYFPGARTVALRTPFDLTVAAGDPWKLRADDCNNPTAAGCYGEVAAPSVS